MLKKIIPALATLCIANLVTAMPKPRESIKMNTATKEIYEIFKEELSIETHENSDLYESNFTLSASKIFAECLSNDYGYCNQEDISTSISEAFVEDCLNNSENEYDEKTCKIEAKKFANAKVTPFYDGSSFAYSLADWYFELADEDWGSMQNIRTKLFNSLEKYGWDNYSQTHSTKFFMIQGVNNWNNNDNNVLTVNAIPAIVCLETNTLYILGLSLRD